MNDEAGNKIVEGLHKLWETSLLQNVKANPEWATDEIENQYATRMKYEIEIGELKEKNKKLKIKNKNLQSKIDKAIEWIEQYEKQIGILGETSKSIVLTDDVVIGNLLDILKEDK